MYCNTTSRQPHLHLNIDVLQKIVWMFTMLSIHVCVLFRDFINGPALNDSKDIRDTLDTLHRSQARYNTERITVLQAIK